MLARIFSGNGELTRILRNSGSLIVARVVTKIATTGLIVFIARRLGDERFGVFSTLLAYVAFFSIVEEFGLTVPLIRRIAKSADRPDLVLGRVIGAKIPLGLIAYALLVLSCLWSHVSPGLAAIFGASMFFEMQAISVTRSFEGFERMEYVAYLTIVERVVLCGLGVTVLYLGGGLEALGFAYIITYVIVFVLGLRWFRKLHGRLTILFDRAQFIPILREASPFFLSTLFSVIYNKADIFLLTTLRAPAEVGWYNAAFRVIDAQMFIPVSIVSAIFPVMARHYADTPAYFHRLHSRSFYFLLGLGVLISVTTYFSSDLIITVLYAGQYHQSALTLRILSLMLCFYFVNFLLGNALIAAGRESLSTMTLLLGAVTNLALCTALIPGFGGDGAAGARVVTEVLACAFQMYMLVKVSGTRAIYRFSIPTISDSV